MEKIMKKLLTAILGLGLVMNITACDNEEYQGTDTDSQVEDRSWMDAYCSYRRGKPCVTENDEYGKLNGSYDPVANRCVCIANNPKPSETTGG